MPKVKRDVLRYIDETIEYERGNSKGPTPIGGYERGLNKAEAQLVCETVRRTLAAVGFPAKPEWVPQNQYQEQRLHDAYVRRHLDPTPLNI